MATKGLEMKILTHLKSDYKEHKECYFGILALYVLVTLMVIVGLID